MFQQFETLGAPENGPPRVAALRAAMQEAGVQGFLVPRADAHQGEYVAPHDARLAWLTGFTGSAGSAVVLESTAALFVDGRYTLQAGQQVDTSVLELRNIPKETVGDYVAGQLSRGQSIGFDPWLHTEREIATLRERLDKAGIALVPTENLVDAAWSNQPPPPMGPATIHPEVLAGRSAAEKLGALAADLDGDGIGAVVLTLPDSISWLLNMRGTDIERNPVVHAFAILNADASLDLFIAPAKVNDALRDHLGPQVRLHPPEAFGPALEALSGKVGLDKASAPVWVGERLRAGAADITWMRDPCILPKACKTEAELAGARSAHLRDAAAMIEFLAWLDEQAPKGTLTEIDVVKALEAKRRATNALRDISFETISGAGPNGAIVHYRVSEDSNRTIAPGELLLVDSGGQYGDGTTDITRTIATGPAPEGAVRAFTLVLKGLINLSRQRWPEGLAGRDLDAIARAALWNAGFDYDHGTGHGVGAYLSVHEGPQNLSRRGEEPLKPGMILSIEPGYYRTGAYGIRIENLVAVTAPDTPAEGDRAMLGFETLTHVPIDVRLIDAALLSGDERDWLNAYHAHVAALIAPSLSAPAADWLDRATRPL
ncbi:aminopeptidase P family protein [Oceanibium sediminis]|uniref:aminopeptidase P family protein n=1 Tax=Oceanibium sediminis TaxID=2026339 RepID=UPI000DD33F0F|nr:aminopeptidase P family protein [Oceanibium sediminis]